MSRDTVSKKRASNVPNGKGGHDRKWPVENIKRWSIAQLLPYARNPKTHPSEQVALIARSMERFGQAQIVLVDGDAGPAQGEIIAGHGRVLAAEQLGWDAVVVGEARGWSDEEKRAYRIMDNELGSERLAPYDMPFLRVEVGALKLLDFDLTLLGFDETRLERLDVGDRAPEEFQALGDDIQTQHCCPSCGYRWSGRPDAGTQREVAGENEGG